MKLVPTQDGPRLELLAGAFSLTGVLKQVMVFGILTKELSGIPPVKVGPRAFSRGLCAANGLPFVPE